MVHALKLSCCSCAFHSNADERFGTASPPGNLGARTKEAVEKTAPKTTQPPENEPMHKTPTNNNPPPKKENRNTQKIHPQNKQT